jgi:hypothetical protein
MTTPTRPPLEEMRARAEAATAGPWETTHPEAGRFPEILAGAAVLAKTCPIYGVAPDGQWTRTGVERANAALMAHARTDLPAALDWIAHVEGLLARALPSVEKASNVSQAFNGYEPQPGASALSADIRAALGGGR